MTSTDDTLTYETAEPISFEVFAHLITTLGRDEFLAALGIYSEDND